MRQLVDFVQRNKLKIMLASVLALAVVEGSEASEEVSAETMSYCHWICTVGQQFMSNAASYIEDTIFFKKEDVLQAAKTLLPHCRNVLFQQQSVSEECLNELSEEEQGGLTLYLLFRNSPCSSK